MYITYCTYLNYHLIIEIKIFLFKKFFFKLFILKEKLFLLWKGKQISRIWHVVYIHQR